MRSSAPRFRNFPVTTSGTVLIHVDFLLAGIVMTFLGPLLPILVARWGISDAVAGRLFLTQFISSMIGMLVSAQLVQRQGYRRTFIVGLVLMAAGTAMLASGPFLVGITAVAILGMGHGITTPAGNLRTAEINPHGSASALNVINAVWGIGALSPSFLLNIARHFHRPNWFLYGTALLLSALLATFAMSRFEPDTHDKEADHQSSTAEFFSSGLLVQVSLVFFIYVGSEVAFGQWLATYAHRMNPTDLNLWTMMPSFFYGALLAGRTLAPFVLKSFRETKVAKIGLILALMGGVTLVRAHGTGWIAIGSLLAGLGLASIFPISVSLFTTWFGASARRASTMVFAMGNLGGAVFPWLVGVVSTHSGGLRVAFFVPLGGCALMMIFYLFNGRQAKALLPTPVA
jgi:MFS transporter, FHS family, glucose/mannose:H+ symporter